MGSASSLLLRALSDERPTVSAEWLHIGEPYWWLTRGSIDHELGEARGRVERHPGAGATVAQEPEPRPKLSGAYRNHHVKHEPVFHRLCRPVR